MANPKSCLPGTQLSDGTELTLGPDGELELPASLPLLTLTDGPFLSTFSQALCSARANLSHIRGLLTLCAAARQTPSTPHDLALRSRQLGPAVTRALLWLEIQGLIQRTGRTRDALVQPTTEGWDFLRSLENLL